MKTVTLGKIQIGDQILLECARALLNAVISAFARVSADSLAIVVTLIRRAEQIVWAGARQAFLFSQQHTNGALPAILVRRQSKAYDVRMLDWAECQQVEHVEDKVSGAWVFRGTRIPVRALLSSKIGRAHV